METEFSRQNLDKYSIQNFMKMSRVEAQFLHANGRTDGRTYRQSGRQTDRQTDRQTKLIVDFRNFANAHEKEQKNITEQ
jgi:hypothetical protein